MTDRTVPTEEMIAAGLEHYAEGGCMGLTEDERREAVYSILAAALAASPAAPGAEVEPVAFRWRYRYSDGRAYGWAYQAAPLEIPAENDTLAALEVPSTEVEPLYLSPPTTDAIRAQARREAAEAAQAIAQEAYDGCEKAFGPCSETGAYECDLERSGRDCLCMHGFSVAEALAERLEVVAGKPGEAE